MAFSSLFSKPLLGLTPRPTPLSLLSPSPAPAINPCPSPPPPPETSLLVSECCFGGTGQNFWNLKSILGVVVMSTNDIAVLDGEAHCIKVYDARGNVKFSFGSKGFKKGEFLEPSDLAVVRPTGDFLVLEASEWPRVHVFNFRGEYIRVIGVGYLRSPRAIAADNGGDCLAVLQTDGNTGFIGVEVFYLRIGVHKWTLDMTSRVGHPTGLAVMESSLDILISDERDHCVKVFAHNGTSLFTIGGPEVTRFPVSVSIDGTGDVFVGSNHSCFHVAVFEHNAETQVKKVLLSHARTEQPIAVAVTPQDGGIVMAYTDMRIEVHRPVDCWPGSLQQVTKILSGPKWSDSS